MTQELQIRKAYPEDAQRIRQIHVDAIEHLCASHYTTNEINIWISHCNLDSYRQTIQHHQNEQIYVAYIDAFIVGFSALEWRELCALYIDPNLVGQGVGKTLLLLTEDIARQNAMDRLFLDASLNAVLFYQSQGYEMLGPSTVPINHSLELPAIRMKKSLLINQHTTLKNSY